MFAVIAFICGIVAAILKLTNQHANFILWLLIIGLIAVSVEVLWGWHRAGYYGRRGPARLMYIGLGAVLLIIVIVVLILFLWRR